MLLQSHRVKLLLVEFSRFHKAKLLKALLPERGHVVSEGQRAAAKRIRAELQRADAGNFGTFGWSGYMARRDVEALLEAVGE